ncbi:MAG: hypothetical protein ACE5FD_19520 [Anaerolineae bacterium]
MKLLPSGKLQSFVIDGRTYHTVTHQSSHLPPDAPRLVIVSYLPNETAVALLRACVQTIQKFTLQPHELWIVDNNSPPQNKQWLLDIPQANIIFNQITPDSLHTFPLHRRLWHRWRGFVPGSGSYANAIALEIAARLVDPGTRYFMPLHMDTAATHSSWLPFLLSKLGPETRAAGVRLDTARVPQGILHVLGVIFDFQLFRQLNLTFLPDPPRFDVGDKISWILQQKGYQRFACRNSMTHPEIIADLPPPYRDLSVDRAVDDNGRVIFIHLGRGVQKARGVKKTGTLISDWLQFIHQYLLTTP